MHMLRNINGLPVSSRGALVVLAATLAMAAGFGGLGLITVFMGPMESDLGWSRSQTSLGYAMSTAGMAIGGVIWGRLSDRIDLRLPLAVAASGMIGALLIMATLRSLPVFYVASIVYGALGFSALYAPLLSTSGEWFPQQRGLVMGIVTSGGALGQGLLPFMANLLIAAFGWRWAFAGMACTFLLVLGFALPLLKWPQGRRPPRPGPDHGPQLAGPERAAIGVLGLAAFLCCLCMGIPVVHMANFIGMVCASPRLGVESLVMAMSCAAVGRVCYGFIADRIGPLRAYGLASLTQTGCVLLFPTLADSLSLLALSAIFGFGFGGDMTCFSLCVRRVVPANRFGAAMGAVMMMAWVGMAAGGYLGGLLFEMSQSYTASFLLAGLAGVFNLAALAAIEASRDRAWALAFS